MACAYPGTITAAQYYQVLQKQRDLVHQFYTDASTMLCVDGTDSETDVGMLIKREIPIMKLVRHLYVVRLHEVLASRAKIYIILEFITCGELFDKIVHRGRLSETEARIYFQQLIDGVDYCHSKGVYHRYLKPENLLLDSQGNLRISYFGLSALPEEGVSLLRTTYRTPNYVAPEVLSHKGNISSVAEVWSCGVILYVLLAGYLPFNELDLTTLYNKDIDVCYAFVEFEDATGALNAIQVCKPTDKNLKFLLQKVLKQSDVGSLGRIVLPKKEAETYLLELEARDGISIAMEDIGTSRVWNMRYIFWPNSKSRMYFLENTGRKN